MTTLSSIEWTEQTWNPVTGCTKISPGCKHCYAETMTRRLTAMNVKGYENGFVISTHPERLNAPLLRKRPTIYFVNSMSDLFHEGVSDDFVDQVLDVIKRTPQHTYQILTKRAERLPVFFANRAVPTNMWLGVSVEDIHYGIPRIDELRKVNANIRFLSIEPLLEDLGEFNLEGIHWVIVGGESGFGARRMNPEWVTSIRNQCVGKGVAFFFKQWGAFSADGVKKNKKVNGRVLDGRKWEEYPSQTNVSS
ncbi:MAG: hypothetical protein CTY33_10415 [Methylotenera sp.]|nr:MAG: hypothetical protein CTY33_10415 [Methylotenera sp.]